MTTLQVLLLILCGVAIALDTISWSGDKREYPRDTWLPLYVMWVVAFVSVAGVLWQLIGRAIG